MSIYQEYGFANRRAYLRSLAEEYCVPYSAVVSIASVLGSDEDFDALVTEIEDYADMMAVTP